MDQPPDRPALKEGDAVLVRARVRAVYPDTVTIRILNAQGAGFAQLGVAPQAIAGHAEDELDVPALTWR